MPAHAFDGSSARSEPEYDSVVSEPQMPVHGEMQVLYEGTRQCTCCISWVEAEPGEVDTPDDDPDTPGFAVVVRKRKDHSQDAPNMYTVHSITIRSKLAKPLLYDLFQDYPNLNLNPSAPTFAPPFAPFFERWAKWETVLKTTEDEKVLGHLKLVDGVIRKELDPAFKAHEMLLHGGLVSFDLAWTIFRIDDLIYKGSEDSERLYQLKSWDYRIGHGTDTRALFGVAEEMEWNGHSFQRKRCEILICREFQGHVDISRLEAYPLRFCPDPKSIKLKLVARGRRYADLKGISCKDYTGIATDVGNEDIGGRNAWIPSQERQIQVDGRIMIDAAQWHRNCTDAPPSQEVAEYVTEQPQLQGNRHRDRRIYHEEPMQPQGSMQPPRPRAYKLSPGHSPCGVLPAIPYPAPPLPGGTNYDSDSDSRRGRWVGGGRARNAMLPDTEVNRNIELSEEELAICTPLLKGYSLATRKWLRLDVDCVRDVGWNTQAFNQLALPDEYKELIQATIEMQIRRHGTFDDFIRGKGKGLIMLLSGSSGVGKTATVEAMSEMLKVPLYHMSAANLGTNAVSIDEKLRDILKITARWNAVLLLDEADIFLERRMPQFTLHNAIVSTFLQSLEYHEGVLCLTTNRVHTLDSAVLSRVHVNLVYPDLDATARKSIWRRFAVANANLDTGADDYGKEIGDQEPRSLDITENEFEVLAQSDLDGRQIKNVFKTAALLAGWKREPLNYQILQRALKIYEMQVSLLTIRPRDISHRVSLESLVTAGS